MSDNVETVETVEEIIEIPLSDITMFERIELISARSVALEKGRAVPLIEIGNITNPIKIATMELELGVIPYTIKRVLPDGTYKLYKIKKALR